ncbi:hypothetical protein MJG53_009963 [Ovis ammon polii x Ovis aries]|uniref:Uncharacterized protein n=1 Tax=Ovis ammon polii x Ovis aries TaxID=2918886 RepID=A0ACB9UWF1_9CETA|nr:hypothetical protein MJG53_009963 [Ovis ammon polii x Ovis aries]
MHSTVKAGAEQSIHIKRSGISRCLLFSPVLLDTLSGYICFSHICAPPPKGSLIPSHVDYCGAMNPAQLQLHGAANAYPTVSQEDRWFMRVNSVTFLATNDWLSEQIQMDNPWSLGKCGKSDEEGVGLANGKRFEPVIHELLQNQTSSTKATRMNTSVKPLLTKHCLEESKLVDFVYLHEKKKIE